MHAVISGFSKTIRIELTVHLKFSNNASPTRISAPPALSKYMMSVHGFQVFFGMCGDYLGRKKIYLLTLLIIITATIGQALASSTVMGAKRIH